MVDSTSGGMEKGQVRTGYVAAFAGSAILVPRGKAYRFLPGPTGEPSLVLGEWHSSVEKATAEEAAESWPQFDTLPGSVSPGGAPAILKFGANFRAGS